MKFEPPFSLPAIPREHTMVGVGGFMESQNFVSGTSGWRLTGEGNFEGNDGTFRGSITGATGTFSGEVTATLGTIGGWTIASDAIHTGTKDASGYTASGITLSSGGSIHSKQFYIDSSGNAYFKGTLTAINISTLVNDSGFTDDTTANTKISAADVGPSGTTTISGSRITTGTLNASLVNVTNLNASNITSGSISGSKVIGGSIPTSTTISGGSITTGTMDAARINGGTITGTSVSVTGSGESLVVGGSGTGRVTFNQSAWLASAIRFGSSSDDDAYGAITYGSYSFGGYTFNGISIINNSQSAGIAVRNTGSYNIALDSGSGILLDTGTNAVRVEGDFQVRDSGTGTMLLVDYSASRVGINDSTPSYTLDVNGTCRASTLRSNGWIHASLPTTASGANVRYISSTGALYYNASSAKYKKDIETLLDSEADKIFALRPTWYRSSLPDDPEGWSWDGFIAEEVHEINPRWVVYRDGEPDSMNYDQIVPSLVNIIQRQEARLQALEA